MTAITPHPTSELVAIAWTGSLPNLTTQMVAVQLPPRTSWTGNTFVTVTVVGGSPLTDVLIRQSVVQYECWGVKQDSDKPFWAAANQVAEQIIFGSKLKELFGRPLPITSGGKQYNGAQVMESTVLTDPRRKWDDPGYYACYTFDMRMVWREQGLVYN